MKVLLVLQGQKEEEHLLKVLEVNRLGLLLQLNQDRLDLGKV